MKTPIAFVSDIWRRRFGWDARGGFLKDCEPLAHMHCCDYPLPPDVAEKFRSLATSSTAPTVTVTIRAFDGEQIRDLINRSTESKE